MTVLFQKRIYRDDLKDNPNTLYLFGDNLEGVGMGGQAREMRGELNAVGIPTKNKPTMEDDAFFTDDKAMDYFAIWAVKIEPVVLHLVKSGTVVIPKDGLGTGYSEMPERCPTAYMHLCNVIAGLFMIDGFVNKNTILFGGCEAPLENPRLVEDYLAFMAAYAVPNISDPDLDFVQQMKKRISFLT